MAAATKSRARKGPAGDPDGEGGGADLGAASGGQGGQGQRQPEGVRQVGQLFDLSTSTGRYGRLVLGVEGGVEQLGQKVVVPLRARRSSQPHLAPQGFERPELLHAYGTRLLVEQGTDLSRGEAGAHSQPKHLLVGLGELAETTPHLSHVLAVDGDLLPRGFGPVGRLGLVGHDHQAGAVAVLVGGHVAGDPEQPGPEGVGVPRNEELLSMAAREGFRQSLTGVVPVVEPQHQVPHQRSPVGQVSGLPRGGFAPPGGVDSNVVERGHRAGRSCLLTFWFDRLC